MRRMGALWPYKEARIAYFRDGHVTDMPIKALAPWFGAKRNLAGRIVEMLGPHRIYWEPLCGSMAVLLAKEPCVVETVNDLHGDLINLARIIADPDEGPRFYRRMRRTLMHEESFKAAAAVMRAAPGPEPDMDLPRGDAFFITSWLGRNGVIGAQGKTLGYCARYTANGGHGAKRWDSAIKSIPAWRRRLRNVMILNKDAFELLEKIEDAEGLAMYVDPPYLCKGAKYDHDFEQADHERLAGLLGRFKRGRVIVSYYDDPRLAELYPGWHQEKIIVSKALANQGQRGRKDVKATEVLLVNQPVVKETVAEKGLFE